MEIIFPPLGLALNSCIILSSCGNRMDHRKVPVVLVQNLLEMSSREPHPQFTPRRRRNPPANQRIRHIEHWTVAGWHLQCHVCAACHKRTATKFQCTTCKVGLCLHPCFRIYHSELHFWM